ncbi:charged multivesicular body protein 4b [Lingula anatina]|uniref:Charged multivesicular body protein 4b n=1 Tax=Lingula anatina TaxID=7574 RepID=A0A1S3H2M8_LINAN|nr:charged multivesicular body protein 4b [Lingula anatina]|eukprot:XP_013380268.1 charged multivesicular body protein 4b [Lingula anatina]
MSLFGRLFGGKKGEKAPTPQEGIQRLREIEEMLTKKQEYLEKKVDQELSIAKKNGTKNKRGMICGMDVDKVHDLMDDIGEQMDLANEINDAIASPIGFGQDIDQVALLPRDVDKVHDLMDEVAEQQDIANEISEAISNPVGFGTDVDEDELMAELEELEQEDLDAQLLEVGGPVTDQLPSVPVTEPVAKTKGKAQADADDDLAELEMWAS